MRCWRDLSGDAPREATFTAIISGDAVSLGLVWVGDPVVGRARIAEVAERLTDAAEPARRSVEPLTYLHLQTREDDAEGHDWRRYWKGHYFSELGGAVVDAILSREGDDLPDVSLQATLARSRRARGADHLRTPRDGSRVRRRVAVAQPRGGWAAEVGGAWLCGHDEPGPDQRLRGRARRRGEAEMQPRTLPRSSPD